VEDFMRTKLAVLALIGLGTVACGPKREPGMGAGADTSGYQRDTTSRDTTMVTPPAATDTTTVPK
jgi:hypothetical protein